MPPIVRNDDVSHRLLEIVRPSQALAAARVAIQSYPFLATCGYASGGVLDRPRYFSTVDLATSMPSLPNSPTIRGEPQPGLASDILRINALISFDTDGLPGLPCLLSLAQ